MSPIYAMVNVPGEPHPVRLGPFQQLSERDVRTLVRSAGFKLAGIEKVRGCEWCGRAIDPGRPRARFCSDVCRVNAYRARKTRGEH